MPRPGFKQRRRLVLGVIALLLIGMTINVAVAWACVLRYSKNDAFTGLRPVEPGRVVAWFWVPPIDMPVTDVEERRAFGVRFAQSYHMRTAGPGGLVVRKAVQGQQLFRAGWPCFSLKWTDSYDGVYAEEPALPIDAVSVTLHSWRHGVMVLTKPTKQMPYGRVTWVPVMPSGIGFVGNTLVYAGASWLLWVLTLVMPGRLRRWRRRRQSCCERCGYGIAGLDRCPECGANP